ncbi:MAG: DUF697 domain-containing protein [Nitrospira sp.]|nr:DUF697 domain-containing protein [Nitrospira sp.]
MNRSIKYIFVLISLLILVAGTVMVVNQTNQFIQLATQFDERLGRLVSWGLLTLYAVLILTPIVLFFRLPKTLIPPDDETSPAFEKHLSLLKTRLKTNPRMKDLALETREDVTKAIDVLDAQAEDIIKDTASQVFLSTAISQNGNFDAIIVLSLQSKMVWHVAHVYYQRPTLREMAQLYANVVSTAFLVGKLDDIEIGEQIAPIATSALGSLTGAIPGFQIVTSIVTNSIVSGTANAFLTLRVGMITRQYCNARVTRDKKLIRKSAIAEATVLLGPTVLAGTTRVLKSFADVVKNKMKGVATKTGERIRSAATSITDGLTGATGAQEAQENPPTPTKSD